MNGRTSGSNEMLYAMLGGRVGKIGSCDIRELCKQHVILIRGNGNGIEMRSMSCGWPKWGGVEGCCIHKSLAFEVHEQGVGTQEVGSQQGSGHIGDYEIPLVLVGGEMKGESACSVRPD